MDTSIQPVMERIQRLYDLGQRATGTRQEHAAADIIEQWFTEIGLDNVRKESFPVYCCEYGDSYVRLLDSREEIRCVPAGQSPGSDEVTGQLIDVGFGTAADYETAKIDTNGKIVLIERNDEIQGWPDVPCREAEQRGVIAAILTSPFTEHEAIDQEVVPTPIPAVWISFKDAQKIRDQLNRKGSLEIRYKSSVTTRDGVSYNVVGDLPGTNPEWQILMTAHHDSWWGGAVDNASGAATITDLARILSKEPRPTHSIRFISFGAEEAGARGIWSWLVGSRAYRDQHKAELDRVALMMNFDSFTGEPKINATCSPELRNVIQQSIQELGFENYLEVTSIPSTWVDQWFLSQSGVPGLTLMSEHREFQKIYHSPHDTPALVHRRNIPIAIKFARKLLQRFTETAFPYDFTTYSELYMDELKKKLKKDRKLGIDGLRKSISKFDRAARKTKAPSKTNPSVLQKHNRVSRSLSNELQQRLLTVGGQLGIHQAYRGFEAFEAMQTLSTVGEMLRDGQYSEAGNRLKQLAPMQWAINFSKGTFNSVLDLFETNPHKNILVRRWNIFDECFQLKQKVKEETVVIRLELKKSKLEKILKTEISHVKDAFDRVARKLA